MTGHYYCPVLTVIKSVSTVDINPLVFVSVFMDVSQLLVPGVPCGTQEPSSYGGGRSSGTGGCCCGVDVEVEGAVGMDADDSPILACSGWFRLGISGDPSPGCCWLWDDVNTCPSTGRT